MVPRFWGSWNNPPSPQIHFNIPNDMKQQIKFTWICCGIKWGNTWGTKGLNWNEATNQVHLNLLWNKMRKYLRYERIELKWIWSWFLAFGVHGIIPLFPQIYFNIPNDINNKSSSLEFVVAQNEVLILDQGIDNLNCYRFSWEKRYTIKTSLL